MGPAVIGYGPAICAGPGVGGSVSVRKEHHHHHHHHKAMMVFLSPLLLTPPTILFLSPLLLTPPLTPILFLSPLLLTPPLSPILFLSLHLQHQVCFPVEPCTCVCVAGVLMGAHYAAYQVSGGREYTHVCVSHCCVCVHVLHVHISVCWRAACLSCRGCWQTRLTRANGQCMFVFIPGARLREELKPSL